MQEWKGYKINPINPLKPLGELELMAIGMSRIRL